MLVCMTAFNGTKESECFLPVEDKIKLWLLENLL